MSSTDDARLGRFFDKRLVPLAERLRVRGEELFPMGPDGESESFYVTPEPGEDEFVELDGPAACEKELRELWRKQKMAELDDLAGALMKLARRLEIGEEDSGEISRFVYVMY